MFSPEIILNLIPVAVSALIWAISRWLVESSAAVLGSLLALGVTSVAALPALWMSWSAHGGRLGMGAMITVLLAFASSGAGLVAFLVGYAWGKKHEARQEPERSEPGGSVSRRR